MFRRVMLFMAMNIAVIVLITVIFSVLEHFFGIRLDLYGQNYISIGIYSAIIGFLGAFISLFMAKWSAKKAYGIVPIKLDQVHSLNEKQKLVWNTVSDIASRNNIIMPEVGIYQSNEPNAFATGTTKNSSLVAVSTGLLDIMDKGAIEGVIGHEMSHVLNGDMVTMTLLQGVLNTFIIFFARIVSNIIASRLDKGLSGFAYMGVNILLEMIFGLLAIPIAMKFSRYREFRADEGSARLLGKEKMIAGLEALKRMQTITPDNNSNLATMKISTKGKTGLLVLFSSHPSLDDRIKALEDLKI